MSKGTNNGFMCLLPVQYNQQPSSSAFNDVIWGIPAGILVNHGSSFTHPTWQWTHKDQELDKRWLVWAVSSVAKPKLFYSALKRIKLDTILGLSITITGKPVPVFRKILKK